jgi:hypothetical protein
LKRQTVQVLKCKSEIEDQKQCYRLVMRVRWGTATVGLLCLTAISASIGGFVWRYWSPSGPAQYEWSFEAAGYRPIDQAPLTTVAVHTQTTTYPVGVFVGKCLPIEMADEGLLNDELTAVICSWMDSGVEIGVFQAVATKEIRTIDWDETSKGAGYRNLFRSNVLFQLNANDR